MWTNSLSIIVLKGIYSNYGMDYQGVQLKLVSVFLNLTDYFGAFFAKSH